MRMKISSFEKKKLRPSGLLSHRRRVIVVPYAAPMALGEFSLKENLRYQDMDGGDVT